LDGQRRVHHARLQGDAPGQLGGGQDGKAHQNFFSNAHLLAFF